MYGYIRICKPELKFREFDEYRAYYCGLCRTLKERSGNMSRMLLSYDLTFLTMLLDGLYEPEVNRTENRCVLHPLKKQLFIQSKSTEYAADMTLLLAAYKFEDDWNDERRTFKKIFAAILENKTKAVRERYIIKAERIEAALSELAEIEKNGCEHPEEPAGCFGKVLAEVLAYKEDEWENTLKELGFFLGKYIYLADAAYDLEKDKKTGNFNPFSQYDSSDPEFRAWAEEMQRIMLAQAAAEFEYLPIIKNAGILRNILYAGARTDNWGKNKKNNKGDKI
jgi:hypothetical protein